MMLRTLGGLKLHGADFHQTKPLLLLTYLATEGAKERHVLWHLLWPRAANPANNLRAALYDLRHGLPGALEATGTLLTPRLQTDVDELLRALEQGDSEKVQTLYQGAFLDGLQLQGISLELEEWIYTTREYVAKRVRTFYLGMAETSPIRGRSESPAIYADRAYLVAGAPPLEPEEIERLYPLLVAAGSPYTMRLRHEAEDLNLVLTPSNKRFHGTQSDLPGEFVAQKLPASASTFVGRVAELHQISELLHQPDCRLLTLTGLGGVGKTRLALEVARENVDWSSAFVSLAALSLPHQIPAQIGNVLALELQDREAQLPQVAQQIGEARLLLVLDNFEHLLAGAHVISELLEQCPNLKVLATSREPLDLADEWTLQVEGLAFGDGAFDEDALQQDAAQLFLQRAKRARLNFAPSADDPASILEICRSVQGLPLALELAATWSKALSYQEVATELRNSIDFLRVNTRDRAERHKSIRAVFESSWELLKPEEQAALSGLSVFQGGFRREAAAELVGATIPLLVALVDKSLLRVDAHGRYDRHPLLYKYINEKLSEERRFVLQGRHAAHLLTFAEALNLELKQPQDAYTLELLEREYQNLRAALDWSTRHAPGLALQLAGALGRFWEIHGYLNEGIAYLQAALGAEQESFTKTRARALAALGTLFLLKGETDLAKAKLEEGLILRQSEGDGRGVAEILNRLGHIALQKGDEAEAEVFYQESLTTYRELSDQEGMATLLNNLGEVTRCRFDFLRAKGLYEQSLRLCQEIRDMRGKAIVLGNLASVSRHLGEAAQAKAQMRESLLLKYELRDEIGLSYCFAGLAGLACDSGQPEVATQLLGITDALLERKKHKLDTVDQADAESVRNQLFDHLGAKGFTASWEQGQAMTLEEAVELGTSF